MGRYKVNNDGTLGAMISGRGKAEYGASTMRTGQATLTMLENQPNYAKAIVTFEVPMPDANYEVILSKPDIAYYQANINVTTKTVNGFNITASSFAELQSTAWSSIKVNWCAFKLYTDTEYNDLLAKANMVDVPLTLNMPEGVHADYLQRTICKKIGYMCYLHFEGRIALEDNTKLYTLATLPEKCRPVVADNINPMAQGFYIGASMAMQTGRWQVRVLNDGSLQMRADVASQTLSNDFFVVADFWYPTDTLG